MERLKLLIIIVTLIFLVDCTSKEYKYGDCLLERSILNEWWIIGGVNHKKKKYIFIKVATNHYTYNGNITAIDSKIVDFGYPLLYGMQLSYNCPDWQHKGVFFEGNYQYNIRKLNESN